MREGKPAYALTDDWLGPRDHTPLGRDRALAELARRYVSGHPPAAPEDMAAWSGLGLRETRRAFAAIEGELEAVRLNDRSAWISRSAPREVAPPTVRLLPAFDGLLLAHRDRLLTVDPVQARTVLPGGGVLRPTVLVNGRVEGTWRLTKGAPEVDLFGELDAGTTDALASEQADVVRHRGS